MKKLTILLLSLISLSSCTKECDCVENTYNQSVETVWNNGVPKLVNQYHLINSEDIGCADETPREYIGNNQSREITCN